MVATVHILNVDPDDPRSVGDLAGYYASAEYYAASGGTPGVWFGRGAAALNLEGPVTAQALRRLFLGKSPDGKRQLVPARRRSAQKKDDGPEAHIPGYDLTFSVPKSVSALWALSDDPVRELIERSIDEAVRESLQWMEDNLTFVRRGKGGRHHQLANLVIAMFDHTTARNAQDPGLHRHCAIANLAQGVRDKRWSKPSSQMLLRWTRTIGPMFRNTLYLKLRERLSVEAYRPQIADKGAGWFELRGVSERLTDEWSSRRKEVLAEAELSNGKCSTAKARQHANLRTRRPKGATPSAQQLKQKWEQTAARLGVTRDSLQAACGRPDACDVEQRVEQAITEATDTCLADRSYFSRHKFIQAVSESLQDVPISGVEVARRSDAELLRNDLFHKIQTKQSREPVYTSQEMWNLEKRLLSTVERLNERTGVRFSAKAIQRLLDANPELSREQAAAVKHTLESSKWINCLTGVAGSGKTRTLNALRSAYERAGYKVIGAALSGAAKEELAAQSGVSARTVASYEYHLTKPLRQKFIERLKHDIRMLYRAACGKSTWQRTSLPKLDKRTVMFVDESGMLDTRHMNFLVQTAKKTGMKLLLVGDPKQLNPIGPGGPFKRIIEMTPTSHLDENFRQKHSPEDAQAAADLRNGRIDKMLESYLRRGRLKVANNRSEAARQLVVEWSKDGSTKRPDQAIILTQTRAEASHINRLCQQERQLNGGLGRRFVRISDETYHVGDRVLFHEARRRKGIENGYQATITAIHPVSHDITFRLDREPSAQQKKLGRTQTVTLKASEISATLLTLGYAATTHKMQGQSRARAYCLMGGQLTNQELAYVQITRGARSTKLFIDRDHAGRKLQDLAAALSTSGEKKLAHDLGLRLRIEKNRGDNS